MSQSTDDPWIPELEALMRAAIDYVTNETEESNQELVRQAMTVGALEPYTRDQVIYLLARLAARQAIRTQRQLRTRPSSGRSSGP